MASTVPVLLLLSAGLFTVTVGSSSECLSYTNSFNQYKPSKTCGFYQHCCGTCDNRYCCSIQSAMFSESEQRLCNEFSHDSYKMESQSSVVGISVSVMSIVIFIIVFITCCCCPCCCMYEMCRKPRPVAGTHITTVVNTQSIQPQPVVQGAQYPAYQPVPTQPGYGGQPMQMGPYPGQPYAPGHPYPPGQPYVPGPPPSYHMAVSPGYPTSQAGYDGGQATCPMLPPAQPGTAHLPPDTFNQPAYNPAYTQPPKTGY